MTKKSAYARSLLTVALAGVFALPLSAHGENRPRNRTDLASLVRELERVLGEGSVEVRRGGVEVPATSRRETESQSRGRPSRTASHDASAGVLAEMNRERAGHGLAPLRLDDRLNAAAADRAADMFALGYFNHVSPDGRSPFLSVQNRGYRYATVGENLAAGYRTPQAVVSGWMRSPGHRANILGSSFDEVGLAVVEGSPIRGYGGPTVVALYASER
jgi:uncharacterized protein YkwD